MLSPTIAEQDALLHRLGAPGLIPYDSDNRRNVGYLLSWMGDADLVISVDDDNFPVGPEFFTEHLVVTAGPRRYLTIDTASGWWNPCDQLDIAPLAVYPRGFPYQHRRVCEVVEQVATVDVRVNAGLWLGDPDVDAITRMAIGPTSRALRRKEAVLGSRTWAPINSQNTALHRDTLPAYYFPRMGYYYRGQKVDRYADIFSGYFVQACARHLGHGIRFGSPLADHKRNVHYLIDDLRQEMSAIAILDDLLDWLKGCDLNGSTYAEAYRSLSYQMQDAVEHMSGPHWDHEIRGFMHQISHLMRQWLDVLERARGAAHSGPLRTRG
ncbi:hypothetical protein [Micromonospora inyonensis]|uniref:Reversibly glycosylated polypeptide n=1 Tax=Micromonospora inyonensis TaxID=47866 RepID=A0A1C6RLB8_9ACTN|nr:hypothetical protein [Micromonospora inyonensis]SCL17959.1 Reversibly glycosylated polypeptide [Micromonospora inyonensis]